MSSPPHFALLVPNSIYVLVPHWVSFLNKFIMQCSVAGISKVASGVPLVPFISVLMKEADRP